MNYTAIVPRSTKKKTPTTRPGVKGAGVTNAIFIAHAFAGIGADEVPWVAGFPGDVATADHKVWFGSSALPMPRFIRDTHNNYVCVSTFNRAEDGKLETPLLVISLSDNALK